MKEEKKEFMQCEVREAIAAGERALSSLYAAESKLDSARSWGLWDLLGGGMLSSFVKHSKMNEAAELMENAKKDLKIFERELMDVQIPMEFDMKISDFLTFADFFFDGIVADYLVQSRINDTKRKVWDAINQVEKILSELRNIQ